MNRCVLRFHQIQTGKNRGLLVFTLQLTTSGRAALKWGHAEIGIGLDRIYKWTTTGFGFLVREPRMSRRAKQRPSVGTKRAPSLLRRDFQTC